MAAIRSEALSSNTSSVRPRVLAFGGSSGLTEESMHRLASIFYTAPYAVPAGAGSMNLPVRARRDVPQDPLTVRLPPKTLIDTAEMQQSKARVAQLTALL
jgi:hypothetical protein